MNHQYIFLHSMVSTEVQRTLDRYSPKGWKLDKIVAVPSFGYSIVLVKDLD